MASYISSRAVSLRTLLFAATAAGPLLAFSPVAAPFAGAGTLASALSQDVTLENIVVKKDDKGSVTITKAVFEGTNLSKEEIAKLFSATTSKEENGALVAKLSAAKISISEISVTIDKNVVTLHDFTAVNVNAGKAATAGVAGFDAAVKIDSGDVAVKGGALTISDPDFSTLIAGLNSGDITRGAFRYSKFDWAGLNAVFPDPQTPKGAPGGNLVQLAVGALTSTASYDGDAFRKGDASLKSIVVIFPRASSAGQALAAFGYERLDLGLSFAGDYDPAAKKLNVTDYTLSGVNMGAFGIKAQLGAIEKEVFGAGDPVKRAAAWAKGSVSGFSLKYVNNGLFEKSAAFLAAQQKKTPDALKKEWAGMAQGVISAMLGGSPDAKKLADAVAAFIGNPKSLTITAKAKGGAIPFAEMKDMKSPLELLPRVDLSASANQ